MSQFSAQEGGGIRGKYRPINDRGPTSGKSQMCFCIGIERGKEREIEKISPMDGLAGKGEPCKFCGV